MNKSRYAPRITCSTVKKLLRLLNMDYKPSEIAEELNLSVKTIYRYLDMGSPHRTDKTGSIWVNGVDFREWAKNQLSSNALKPKVKADADQAWCCKCRSLVHFSSTITRKLGKRVVVHGTCSVCSGKVVKIHSLGEKEK